MTFTLSKVLWALVNPATFLLLLLTAGWLSLKARPRLGRRMVGLATLGLLAVGFSPLDHHLARPLEDRFPRPAPPADVEGVIVLGGYTDAVMQAQRGLPEVAEAADRLLAFVELARRYPAARLIASGGAGSLVFPQHKEAAVTRGALEMIGFDTGRVIFEATSRNTWENAVDSARLAFPGGRPPRNGGPWLLITSAMHMPRAMGVFRRDGWNVIPWPCDYRTTPRYAWDWQGAPQGRMERLSLAVKEWLGLIAYRFMGRTDAFLPGP